MLTEKRLVGWYEEVSKSVEIFLKKNLKMLSFVKDSKGHNEKYRFLFATVFELSFSGCLCKARENKIPINEASIKKLEYHFDEYAQEFRAIGTEYTTYMKKEGIEEEQAVRSFFSLLDIVHNHSKLALMVIEQNSVREQTH